MNKLIQSYKLIKIFDETKFKAFNIHKLTAESQQENAETDMQNDESYY